MMGKKLVQRLLKKLKGGLRKKKAKKVCKKGKCQCC
jgi:hypothetical protein